MYKTCIRLSQSAVSPSLLSFSPPLHLSDCLLNRRRRSSKRTPISPPVSASPSVAPRLQDGRRMELRGDICRLMINMTLRSGHRACQTPLPQAVYPFSSLHPPPLFYSLHFCLLAAVSLPRSLFLIVFDSIIYT